MTDSLKPWPLMAPALAMVTVLGVLKVQSDDFRRPLGEDELITLRVYTGAGTNGDGPPRNLARREQLEALRPLSGAEWGVAAYASLGRWVEPNNHVVHSASVNPFLGRVHPIEAAVRLPALLAAGAFALSLAWLCIVCGRPWGAPVAAALGMVWPYVSWYAAESRGYALMMLFLVLFLLAARWMLSRPASILASAILTSVAVLTVMNLINLSADWIAPGFLLIFLVPHWIQPSLPDLAAARKATLAVGLATAAILGVFVVDRLPYLVSAMRQYGVLYDGWGGYAEQVRDVLDYLFPTLMWKGIGLVGFAGALVAAYHRSSRAASVLGLAALLASAGHFAVTGKFPYLRNCGYLLLPILFGAGVLTDAAIRSILGLRWRWLLATAVTVTVSMLERIEPLPNPDPHYVAFTRMLSETPIDGTPGRVVLERRVPKSLDLYFPANWEPVETPFPASGTVDLVRIEKTVDDYGFVRERFAVVESGRADRIVWHPPFATTAVNPEPILAELRRAGAKTIEPFHARYHAKLAVLSRVTVILAEGTDEAAIRRVADQHGGSIVRLRKGP